MADCEIDFEVPWDEGEGAEVVTGLPGGEIGLAGVQGVVGVGFFSFWLGVEGGGGGGGLGVCEGSGCGCVRGSAAGSSSS